MTDPKNPTKNNSINATELEQANARCELALYGGNLGMWDWHIPTGNVVFNERWCEMLGHKVEDINQNVTSWSERVHPQDWDIIKASLEPHQKGETPRYECEHRMRHKEGHYLWILDSGKVVERDEQGNAVRIVGTHRDITLQKNHETELLEAKETAVTANRAKSEFLSSMSHELRTPMNAVLGFAQLLQFDKSITSQSKSHIDRIVEAGQHLLVLINDVLDLATIEAGKVELVPDHVNLSNLIEDCLNMVQSLSRLKNISITSNITFAPVISADHKRLKQILLNLLSNAIKYNDNNGAVTIDLQIIGENRLSLSITNTGKGIQPKRLKELFVPFNRLGQEKGTIEGTGVGLSITQKLIELMDGSIEIKSELDKLTTVEVKLPFVISDLHGLQSSPKNHLSPQPSQDTQHQILYIDDDPVNIQLMEAIFAERPGISLQTTLDPSVGLEMAKISLPDLIFLDIAMPILNGYQIFERLKSDSRTKSIPVFAITAYAMENEIKRGRKTGFIHYLTKPLNVAHLLERVDAILEDKTPLV